MPFPIERYWKYLASRVQASEWRAHGREGLRGARNHAKDALQQDHLQISQPSL